jgi:hypothetical protein
MQRLHLFVHFLHLLWQVWRRPLALEEQKQMDEEVERERQYFQAP